MIEFSVRDSSPYEDYCGVTCIAILLFDPVRKHCIVKKRYEFTGAEKPGSSETKNCFIHDTSCRDRFIKSLKTCDEKAILSAPAPNLQNILVRMMLSDSMEVLTHLNGVLDRMDISMSSDDTLRNSLKDWRNKFGRWRKGLLQVHRSLVYVRRVVGQSPSRDHAIPNDPLAQHQPSQNSDQIEISDVDDELQATRTRIDGTFQAIMSTMSMIESQKAIIQAETVGKLTSLAFFFIPLSFVTGIFGMNVVVSLSIPVSHHHNPKHILLIPVLNTNRNSTTI